MPEFKMSKPINIVELMVQTGLCVSKSEAKRVILQNGVKVNGVTINQPDQMIEPKEAVLQKGRHDFIRLTT
jgi:tyrosyl-tRNA synthetase